MELHESQPIRRQALRDQKGCFGRSANHNSRVEAGYSRPREGPKLRGARCGPRNRVVRCPRNGRRESRKSLHSVHCWRGGEAAGNGHDLTEPRGRGEDVNPADDDASSSRNRSILVDIENQYQLDIFMVSGKNTDGDRAIPRPHGAESDGQMRCICGSLLARLVEGGVELKCRRCKRSVVLPLEDGCRHPT